MAKQSALKLKQVFAVVVSVAFAIAALVMGMSTYGDISTAGAANTAMIAFKAMSVGVAMVFCVANLKMAWIIHEELSMEAHAA